MIQRWLNRDIDYCRDGPIGTVTVTLLEEQFMGIYFIGRIVGV